MSIKNEFMAIVEQFKKDHPVSAFRNSEVYAQWLGQTYFFVLHSTALLGFALPHLKNMQLRHHFEHHLGEETRHDLVAMKDIERLGFHVNEFSEWSETQALYQSQYFRVQFEAGTALLGYILLLEGLAVHWGKDIYEEIKDLHKGAALFLKVHAEEDPKHLEDALKTIMSLPVNEQEAILRNLRYSADMYSRLVKRAFQCKKLQAAA